MMTMIIGNVYPNLVQLTTPILIAIWNKNICWNLLRYYAYIVVVIVILNFLLHLYTKLLTFYPFPLNLGLNWGYDVTKENEFWKFRNLTFITKFCALKLVYMQIFNLLFHLHRKLLIFDIFPLNLGLNWGYDVKKGGEFWFFLI